MSHSLGPPEPDICWEVLIANRVMGEACYVSRNLAFSPTVLG